MPERIWGFSKKVSFKTNNVNAQILGFLLNVLSSYAKIRVPDPLLVHIIKMVWVTFLLGNLLVFLSGVMEFLE